MPTNAKDIEKILRSLAAQSTGKPKAATFRPTSSRRLTPVKDEEITTRNYKTVISSARNNIQSQLARRLMELLAADTPKDTGILNGGWTTLGTPITDRANNSPFAIPSELANIITLASSGSATIDIQNAVEYALYVNNGTDKMKARHFVELALRQLTVEARSIGVEITITRG